jgi:hypothetical protein
VEQHWSLEDAARTIAEGFIRNATGMPVRQAEIGVHGDTQVLGQLEQNYIVWRIDGVYFPRFKALDYADPELRKYAKNCTELVFRALRWLYKTSDRLTTFDFALIKSAVRDRVDAAAKDEMVSLGMFLCRDFLNLIAAWGGDPGGNNLALTSRPEILGFESIDAAWKAELERRVTETPTPGQPASGRNSTLVFLSHASADQHIAAELKTTMEAAIPGCDVFVSSDGEDLRPGDPWVETILRKLGDASLLVVLATQRGINRRWVWYESGAGWSRGLRIIPCCVGKIRKGELVAPFSGYQALNVDEEGDLRLLLASMAIDLKLPTATIDHGFRIAEIKRLNEAAQAADVTTMHPDEIQRRLDAVELAVRIDQGHAQGFQLLFENESAENLVVKEIRLESEKEHRLTNPYQVHEDKKRTMASRNKRPENMLTISWQATPDPANRLASEYGIHDRTFTADLIVRTLCEVLGSVKWCRNSLRVQVDPVNRNIWEVF